jgi:hypothetical protein
MPGYRIDDRHEKLRLMRLAMRRANGDADGVSRSVSIGQENGPSDDL